MMQLVCDERYKIAFVKKETALYKNEVVVGQSQIVKKKNVAHPKPGIEPTRLNFQVTVLTSTPHLLMSQMQ